MAMQRSTNDPGPNSNQNPAPTNGPAAEVVGPAAAAHPDRLRAIGLMVLAVTTFACLDTTAKYLVTQAKLPLPQIVWMRFVGQLLVMVMMLGLISVPRLFTTKRLKLQLLRSCLLLGSTLLNFLALRHLRLDQTMTIQFLAPLLVALLAGPLLGEWVGWRRLTAIMVGFLGIIVAIRPGYVEVPPGVVFAFGCMLCYAAFMLLTRYLSAYDSSEVTLTYSMVAGVVLVAPLAIADWTWPSSNFIWLLILSMGLWAALGHFIFILAYRMAPASTIAPFMYTQLLAMTVFGFMVFNELPDQWTILGSTIVVASGIYLVHREHVTRGAKPPPSPVV